MKLSITIFYCLLLAASFLPSCKKILDVTPDSMAKTITKLDDCQALLDEDRVMNGYGSGGYPSAPVICSDEYYVTDGQYDSSSSVSKELITWSPLVEMGSTFADWDLPYRTVATANAVLIALRNIPSTDEPEKWRRIYCGACYYRAFAFYQLAQVFAPAYDSSSAAVDWGIPLPESPDLDQKIVRATVQQTYDRILEDLHMAEALPSRGTDWRPTRPSPAAVHALFSRTYLSARNYTMALRHADSCLQLQSDLMLYDTLDKTAPFPFDRQNPEVIFGAAYYRTNPARIYTSYVDSDLLRSYGLNDLRSTLFFKEGGYFFGTYDQDGLCFAGITTAEVMLTRSECLARTGHVAEAMAELNHLLQSRWAANTFIPYVAADADDALRQILAERKKELLFRGTRWTDLRRLNKDAKTAHSITRTVGGIVYTLPPNSLRWVLPIPDYVLRFNPGMPQNAR